MCCPTCLNTVGWLLSSLARCKLSSSSRKALDAVRQLLGCLNEQERAGAASWRPCQLRSAKSSRLGACRLCTGTLGPQSCCLLALLIQAGCRLARVTTRPTALTTGDLCTDSKHRAMVISFYRDLRRELDFCKARDGARAPLSEARPALSSSARPSFHAGAESH